MQKVVGVITARMNSERLPGKVLKPVMHRPILEYLVERAKLTRCLHALVVSTSTHSSNDEIEGVCRRLGLPCFRGSENDVLSRTLGALESMGATVGVQLLGDCPLLDPAIIELCVKHFLSSKDPLDFLSNDLKTTYPPGMEVQVFSCESIRDANQRASDPKIREHGTLYIRQNPDRYRLLNLEAPKAFFRPEVEVELDAPEDLIVLTQVLEALYPKNPSFGLSDILEYWDAHPELKVLNDKVARRWKEFRKED